MHTERIIKESREQFKRAAYEIYLKRMRKEGYKEYEIMMFDDWKCFIYIPDPISSAKPFNVNLKLI